ncbi:MAG: hypothetical protein A3G47_02210 [Candidatus Zambryskibacteria bacterium RIFCSPLOWO2_12_FULL_39_45]|uniref:Uncharacterized protein n=3 Tax=Candidatus Zambryskiibacteriota TaxID=1817925 RepID=A0A1G2T8S1_9BACT|nr:MAG: hypothetical protein A2W58_02935 [Candidatus Zambryskibacteria bacterium RIFCSPHIGHO2_02_38_10.5]OHA95222.1 MAG: hypothetical protein A3C63_01250 [Candidatus Zambryskibacteria bacterium RIFCSPHIGHO2_02_FULL_39_82]OHA97480.1 MAG: hypothetical protein A3E32_00350 [Candidatus Zambryskibacteria bacterium RIFCSPHIGHO2_12_FULL_38_37]OHB07975.1 MAG: hypothetical protein A2W64_00920 [Candidatus Zambryskibacteria bacterium RIFCSPLOWO2_02_39_10]OHB09594.1 MAG: hypothetical protein A3I21_00335 [Ca
MILTHKTKIRTFFQGTDFLRNKENYARLFFAFFFFAAMIFIVICFVKSKSQKLFFKLKLARNNFIKIILFPT